MQATCSLAWDTIAETQPRRKPKSRLLARLQTLCPARACMLNLGDLVRAQLTRRESNFQICSDWSSAVSCRGVLPSSVSGFRPGSGGDDYGVIGNCLA